MDAKTIAARLRALADEIERDVPISVRPAKPPDVILPASIPANSGYIINPYADSPAMVPLHSDDHLEASPKINDNALSSRYWRIIWGIADKAGVKLTILRGAHPDGCVDVAYPSIGGKLDRVKMEAVRDAFLAICAPPLPPGQEWRDSANPAEIRAGSDVWPFTQNWHIQIDDTMQHRFDDNSYPHFHMRVGT